MKNNLIISVDDFGLSPKANQNILALADMGRLDRIAIMVREKISPEEIQKLIQSDIALDIHLDTPALHVPKKGVFGRSLFFLMQYYSGRISTEIVVADWIEQIELFEKIFGKYPDGINSHQHVHFFPPYFKQIIDLAKSFDIDFLRFGKAPGFSQKNCTSFILWVMRKINRDAFHNSNLDSTDFLISLDWIKNPQEFLRRSTPGTAEIVCHPERQKEFEIIKEYF